jgi:hypothetical protein
VIRRVLGLDTIEPTLIRDEILPLCSDRNRSSILAVMMAVGTARRRGHGAAMGGGCGDGTGSSAGVSSGRACDSGGGGSAFRAPGPSHEATRGPATDPKGKQKVSESQSCVRLNGPRIPPRGRLQ